MILVQERVDLLLRCVESLAHLNRPPSPEVIVVANGTPDAALARLRERPDLVLVPSPVNLGFAGGCNWGARFARGRYIVLLNDDTEVDPDWLRSLVSVAEGDASVGAVGSRLLNPDGSLQEAGSILWRDAGTYQIRDRLPAEVNACDRIRDVDYCSACGLLVTRSAWQAVEGFDEAYFPAYHEDVDLCLSLRAHGFRTIYAPAARVHHHRAASMEAKFRSFAAARNGRYFLAKWADVLHEFEPQPSRRHLATAVAGGIHRAETRRMLAPRPAHGPSGSETTTTAMEALRTQVRALRAAVRLRDEYIVWLQAGGERLVRRGARREALRRLAWRLPGGRNAAAWMSGRRSTTQGP